MKVQITTSHNESGNRSLYSRMNTASYLIIDWTGWKTPGVTYFTVYMLWLCQQLYLDNVF